jgi:nicotinamide riboside transporter PnuC
VTALYWLTAAASLTGVWLNIRHHRACFAIWFCTNTVWATADATHDLLPQAFVQTIYVGLSIHGWRAWGRSAPAAEATS